MKINGIKALDYQCQGDSLTLVLSETDFETVSNLNTALVEVRTDDGDLVEAHGGYALRAITYDKDKQTYTVACTTAADDTTAQAISQLTTMVEELKENGRQCGGKEENHRRPVQENHRRGIQQVIITGNFTLDRAEARKGQHYVSQQHLHQELCNHQEVRRRYWRAVG